MKKAVLGTIALILAFGGLALAQNECDQLYIKAMTANSPAERATLLKDFLAKCGGKGNQYENFANANLCLIPHQGKTGQETINYGEKALQLGGLDDLTKCQVLTTLAAVYLKQNPDKAKAYANQVIEAARAAKAKETEAANAAQWNNLIGAGYYALGQAQEKTKDNKSAIDSYLNSYNILKNAKIIAEIKKVGKTAYEAKAYADAEKAFRAAYQANPKDTESHALVARCLYNTGKTDEALTMMKESYAKNKNGDMAYNIGIILAKQAGSSNPTLNTEALRYLVEASLLSPTYSKKASELAQSMFLGADKEWNNRVKSIQESTKLIEDWTKTFNSKFEGKNVDDLTSDQKREFRRLNENIEKENKILEKLQAEQKSIQDKFQKLLGEAKARLGIR
ncbi:MAG: tetratricopeptide repeat protein [Candidatus Aminicenantes bacterium]|nr:tetratricopeptide repeat protein [Candidatus Aminicenantes bacterium]